MSSTARSRKTAATPETPPERPSLKSVPGVQGPEDRAEGAPPAPLDALLSGRITKGSGRPKRARRKEKLTEGLPGEMAKLGDILAAGRKVESEVDFKLRYAEHKVRKYCLQRFCERYAELGHKPESISYVGENSRFTFIQTRRITLTPEKAETLRAMNVPVDEYTELKGIKINYEAIRHHRLEPKLREALSKMGLSQELLAECFRPEIQLKDVFFEHLSSILKSSLGEGEKLDSKMVEVTQVLEPGSQIRNVETPGMNASDCFNLILESEIQADLTEEEFDAD